MVFSLFTNPDAPAASAKKSTRKVPGLPTKDRNKRTEKTEKPQSRRRFALSPQGPSNRLLGPDPILRDKAEAERAAARQRAADAARREEVLYQIRKQVEPNTDRLKAQATSQREAEAAKQKDLAKQGEAAKKLQTTLDQQKAEENAYLDRGADLSDWSWTGIKNNVRAAHRYMTTPMMSEEELEASRKRKEAAELERSLQPQGGYMGGYSVSAPAQAERWSAARANPATLSEDELVTAAEMKGVSSAAEAEAKAKRLNQEAAIKKAYDRLAAAGVTNEADLRNVTEEKGRARARITSLEKEAKAADTGAAAAEAAGLDLSKLSASDKQILEKFQDAGISPEWKSDGRGGLDYTLTDDEVARLADYNRERLKGVSTKPSKDERAYNKRLRAAQKQGPETKMRAGDAAARTAKGRNLQQLYALMGEGYSADPGTVVDRSYSTSVDEKGADKVGVSAKEFINDFTRDQQGAIQVNTEVLSAIENDTANYGKKNKDGNRYTTLNEVSEADVKRAGFKSKAAYEDAMAIVYGKGPWQRQEKEIIFAPELLTTLIGFGVRDNVGDLKEDYKGVNLMTEDRLKQMGKDGTIDAAAVNKSTADLVESLSEGGKPTPKEITQAAYARSEAGGGAGLYSAASQAQSWNTIANNLRSGYYVGPDGTKTYMEGRYAGTADMDAYQRGILDSLRKDDIDWDFLALKTANDLGRWREKNKGALEPSFNAFFNKDFQVRQNMYGLVYNYIANNVSSQEELSEVLNSPEDMKTLLEAYGISGGNVNDEWNAFIQQLGKETGTVLGDTVTPSSQAGTLTSDTNGQQAYTTALNELMNSVASEEEFKTLMSNPSSVKLALGAAGIDSSLYDYNTLYAMAQQTGKVE